jgi:hypothetical protein
MELRKLEVQQANRHVGLLQSFMGDTFMNRGGKSPKIHTKTFMDLRKNLLNFVPTCDSEFNL